MQTVRADGVAVVSVVGDLDSATVDGAREYLTRELDDPAPLTRLVLDFAGATWVDSVGLGLLVGVRTMCQDRSLALTLRGLDARFLRTLTLSGLADLFDIESSGHVDRFPLPSELALPPTADHKFDQIAELTRRAIDAPRAFVTVVDKSRQAFPGAAGVPDTAPREMPIAYSLCQHVVTSGAPLVVTDAVNDDFVKASPAVVEGLFSAYAGMPLTDLDGAVVGSLCVADDVPREWTPAQLETLADLAVVASSELQLRNAVSDAAVSADRERIVTDLNDRVFKELLSLSILISSAQSITDGRAGQLLDEAALKVDDVLKSLRSTIFDRAG